MNKLYYCVALIVLNCFSYITYSNSITINSININNMCNKDIYIREINNYKLQSNSKYSFTNSSNFLLSDSIGRLSFSLGETEFLNGGVGVDETIAVIETNINKAIYPGNSCIIFYYHYY